MERAATTVSSLKAEQDSGSGTRLNLLLPVLVYAARHTLSAVRYKLMLLDITYYCWVKTINRERQIQALVDKKKLIISEISIRSDLKLDDAEGTNCLSTATIFAELERMGAKTTSWNEFSSNMASTIICLATKQKFNLSKYIFDNMVKNLGGGVKFLMYPRFVQVFLDKQGYTLFSTMMVSSYRSTLGEDSAVPSDSQSTFLQEKVLNLEKAKTALAKEIASLKKRVKQLEKRRKLKAPGLKKLRNIGSNSRVESSNDVSLGAQEDASKQGRKIADLDADAEVTLMDETQEMNDDNLMFDTGVLEEQEKDVAKKEVSVADPVTTAGEVVTTANVEVTTVNAPTITIDELTLAQTLIEIKAAKPKAVTSAATTTTTTRPKARGVAKDKGKGIMVDPKVPLKKKDQIAMDEEVARNLEAQLQAELEEEERISRLKEEKANIDLLEEWDNTQAMMDVDFQLAQQIQKKNKNKLVKDSKTKVEGSSKRAGDELEQEKAKKQKGDDDQEEAKMKRHVEIIKDDDVAIVAIPLATKPLVMVKYQINKDRRMGYFKLIRADGSSKRYSSMIKMLQGIDREDLETLWKLVKAKHENTRPEDDYERVLWGDLKVMFEPDIKSDVWRNLQGYKVTVWKLFDNCGVHFVRFRNLHIFMLVEKRYPLTPITISNMLNKKLQADRWNEMCYQLLKLMTKQEKGQ
ncbi:hypothetical protein Tco_0757254 [Tanacetum coccineum]